MPLESDPDLSDFIGQLYRAAVEPGGWQTLSLPFARLFDAESCLISTQFNTAPAASVICITDNFTPRQMADYEQRYFALDPWRAFGLSEPANPVIGRDKIPDDELLRSEIYADWLKPGGIFQLLGYVDSRWSRAITAGVHRPRRAKEFCADDKRRMRFVMTHFARAVDIARELETTRIERDTALEALERTGGAAIVADATGRVLFANRSAERLLRQADGISAKDGILGALRPAATDRLRALIHCAAETAAGRGLHPGGHLALPRRNQRPLTALVCPMPPADGGIGARVPAALIFVRDPDRTARLPVEALVATYGLTAAEARIAALLADGRSVEDIAGLATLSLLTIRTHLKHVMEKTATQRQGELIALLLKSAAGL